MTGDTDIRWTLDGDIEANDGIDRIPKSQIVHRNAELVQPLREVAGQQRTTREAEQVDTRPRSVRRKGLVAGLEPAARRSEDVPPVQAHEVATEDCPRVRSRTRFQMEHLSIVLDAGIAKARDVGHAPRHALARPLEEDREVHLRRPRILNVFMAGIIAYRVS